MLSSSKEARGHPATLRLTELDVRLSRQISGEIVLKIAYPHIARYLNLPDNFLNEPYSI